MLPHNLFAQHIYVEQGCVSRYVHCFIKHASLAVILANEGHDVAGRYLLQLILVEPHNGRDLQLSLYALQQIAVAVGICIDVVDVGAQFLQEEHAVRVEVNEQRLWLHVALGHPSIFIHVCCHVWVL